MHRLRTRFSAAIALAFLALVALPMPAASADVDDFEFAQWDVEYELSLDGEGRAIAHVTETIVAEFPAHDQNRGIVRALTTDYQGTSTDPQDFAVIDESGSEVPFEEFTDRGYTMLLLGDDSYVHGEQTYVITYTLRDVVLARDDATADEFYWDLIPFDRAQPIDSHTASISFGEGLAGALSGDARCYVGVANSTTECEVSRDTDGAATYTLGPIELQAREGVTVAIALEPGTVTQPFARTSQPLLDIAPGVVAGLGAATAIAGIVVAQRVIRSRATARGTIVPQFEVPRDLPPALAARLTRHRSSPAAAQIIHLAVNDVIRLEEADDNDAFRNTGPALPRLRLLDPKLAVDRVDRRTLESLFDERVPDATFDVPRASTEFGKRMTRVVDSGTIQAEDRGFIAKEHIPLARKLGLIGLVVSALAFVFAIVVVLLRSSGPGEIALAISILGIVVSLFAMAKRKLHTPLGAQTREYLLGVYEFIRVAEADRLEMLQSHEGAERYAEDETLVIRLYEKLLPYAMLTGRVGSWAKVLEQKYRETPNYIPGWYPSIIMHGTAGFAGATSALARGLSSSVSHTSSGSGGSKGGGFAGGGGGGGFAGGR